MDVGLHHKDVPAISHSSYKQVPSVASTNNSGTIYCSVHPIYYEDSILAYSEGSARMNGQDPINSFLDTYESPSIPARQAINCCCGATTCAYLQHTETALSGLERDLRNAAQIGKVRP